MPDGVAQTSDRTSGDTLISATAPATPAHAQPTRSHHLSEHVAVTVVCGKRLGHSAEEAALASTASRRSNRGPCQGSIVEPQANVGAARPPTSGPAQSR